MSTRTPPAGRQNRSSDSPRSLDRWQSPPHVPRRLELAAAVSWRLLVCAAAVVVVALVLARLQLVVLPSAVALMLATVLVPAVQSLRRRGLSAGVAAAGVLAGAAAVVAGALALVIVPVWQESDRLEVGVRGGVERIGDWLVDGPLGLTRRQVDDAIERSFDQIRDHGDTIAGGFVSGGLLALELVAGSLLALVLLFFVLKDGERIWTFVVECFPRRHRHEVRATGARVWVSLGAYLRGVATVALVDAVFIGLGLYLIDVPLVLPLAMFTFLGGFVPIVGATVAGFAAVMVALVSKGIVGALLVLGVVLLVQQLEGHLLQPLIVGRRVELHPLAVILAVAIGGIVWGIPGAFLAVPLTAILATTLMQTRRQRASQRA